MVASSSSGRSSSGSNAKDQSRSNKSVRKSSTVTGGVLSHAFPGAAQAVDPSAHLSSLTDNRSNYPSVARSCLQLNQFAGADLSVLHDATYARICSSIFAALVECVQAHEDRRCRILACKTLAIVARAAYARIRHSPLLFAVREGTLHRLEDEVGTDVPVSLCTAALEDSDDGVSACAVEALGMLTLSSSAMVGTMVEDEFLREIEAISHARPSPYAPSLATLSDEDPSIAQMELQSRVYENALTPRVWRLVRRILHYDSSTHVLRTLPFLTACLVHLVKMTPSSTFGMDRSTFAKRWIEADTVSMTRDVVNCLLLPIMKESVDGCLAHAAVLSALRLAHVCPHEVWIPEVCKWSVVVLSEQLAATRVLEEKLTMLSTLVIAVRAIPLSERVKPLETVVNEVRFLPSTTVAPSGVTCPGIMVNGVYRRPARAAFLAEIAVSFMLDGPADTARAGPLKEFLSSPEVSAIITSRSGKRRKGVRQWTSNQSTTSNNETSSDKITAPGGKTPNEQFVGSHVGEELVLAFCQVASAVGERIFESESSLDDHGHEWLKCSMVILSLCSSCVNWRSRTLDAILPEEDHDSRSLFTMLTAAQTAYIQLMVEVFYAVGNLLPHSSVTLHLVPVSAPSRVLLLEDLAVAISSLAQFDALKSCEFARTDMATLADQFLEYKFREGVPSRHVRIALLALLTDHWIQTLEDDDGRNFNMNDMNARELLTVLSEEIACLSKDLNEGIGTTKVNLHYLDACVACVESIALVACDWGRRHGSSSEQREAFRRDVDEDSNYIISTAMAALAGQNLRESDVLDDEGGQGNTRYPQLAVCAEACQRIESVRMSNARDSALYSLLVTSAAQDFHLRVTNAEPGEPEVFAQLDLSPFIFPDDRNDSPLVVGDSHLHAYFVHYCRQIIGSRTDLSMLSSTVATPLEGSIPREGQTKKLMLVRSINWLRLSAPPLPLHRLPEAGLPLGSRVGWTGSVTTLSGGSDPVDFVLAYAVRRCPRYDCEQEYKLLVTMRVFNITAVTIARGVRMDLRVTQQKSAFAVEGDEEETESNVLTSATAVYKQEIKAGDHVTWEVSVDNWPMKGTIELHSSVTFREVDSEHTVTKLIGPIPPHPMGGDKKITADDDKSETGTDGGTDVGTDGGTDGGSLEDRTIGEDEDEAMDLMLTGEPVRLSPIIGLQPCPLVFFRDGHGDENTFRFLWYQMPHRMPEMMLFPTIPGVKVGSSTDDFATGIAGIATIPLDEYIEHLGVATTGWAFMTLSGNRLLCLMVESEATEDRTSTLHFRADDEALLLSIMGSDSARNSVVASLTRGLWTCDNQVNSLFGL